MTGLSQGVGVGIGQPKPTIEIHNSQWSNSRTVPHEIGHAFGMIHEHMRLDRNRYITFQPSNVNPDFHDQFHPPTPTEINTDYDYLSVMHYRNYDFSIHNNCTPAETDISLQSIYVSGCGLSNTLGGNFVSALDVDTLRAAYNPTLASAFGTRRSASCGTTTYSAAQVNHFCADGSCTAGTVQPIQWTKYNEISGSTCGFAAIRDYPAMCTAKNQEYIRHWFDTDKCSCGLCATRFEWWVACGCSTQQTQSKCTDFSAPLTLQKAQELAASGDPKYAAVGSLAEKLLILESQGHVDVAVLNSIGPSIAHNLGDADFERKFKELSTAIRILSAAKLHASTASLQSWTFTDELYRQYLRRVGFDDSF